MGYIWIGEITIAICTMTGCVSGHPARHVAFFFRPLVAVPITSALFAARTRIKDFGSRMIILS